MMLLETLFCFYFRDSSVPGSKFRENFPRIFMCILVWLEGLERGWSWNCPGWNGEKIENFQLKNKYLFQVKLAVL